MNVLLNNIGKLSKNIYKEQEVLDKYLDKINKDEDKLLEFFSNMKVLINENHNNNNLLFIEFNKFKSEIIVLENNLKLQLKEFNNILNYLSNLNNIDNNDIEIIKNKKKNITKKIKYIKSLLTN
jgi:predicted O-linked N-acetylglucosamine transferase (SPINDLY family)